MKTTTLPVLKTKLRPPLHAMTTVMRGHLINHCNQALTRRTLLLSAPPGYGKTTLLVQWIGQSNFPATAWLSLDVHDNNPVRFITYLLHALNNTVNGAMLPLLELLTIARSPSPTELIAGIISVLEEHDRPVVLVLDDYHLIEEQGIHEALLFLLTHTPDTLHLCISTRNDPPMPLGRLRSLQQLVEVRAEQLIFSEPEADEFCRLNELHLETVSLKKTLYAHTEGWITALQLASLSLRQHPDPEVFIQNFSGSNRTIADYLAEEVFHLLPEETLDFLLKTALLETMCADLCRELTGNSQAGELLLYLEKDNLFVTALDEERQWFRYHQLFRQLLLEKLRNRHPELVQALNLRACKWYTDNNRLDEALEHAFLLDNPMHAITLVDKMALHSSDISFSRKVNRWVNSLSQNDFGSYPQLGIYRAGLALKLSDLPTAMTTISFIKKTLRRNLMSLTESHRQLLSGRLALLEASAALLRGDIPASIDFSNAALSLPDECGYAIQCSAASLLGVLHIWNGEGDMQAAIAAFDRACFLARHTGSLYLYAAAAFQKSIVLHYIGDLVAAGNLLDSLVEELRPVQSAYPGICGSIMAERADLLQEQGEYADALSLATKGLELAESSCEPLSIWWSTWRMACIHYHNLDVDATLQKLDKLDVLSTATAIPFWFTAQSTALRMRIQVDNQQVSACHSLIEQRCITLSMPLSHAREAELLSYSRLLFTERQFEPCKQLLSNLAGMAERTGRTGSLLQVRLLQSELLSESGNDKKATELLLHVLPEAGIKNLVRIVALHRHLIKRLYISKYFTSDARLLEYFQKLTPTSKSVHSSETHFNDLSEREIELLRMLAHGFSNLEIAEKLFISVNTVKTHLKRINGKLGTENRTQAVAEARIAGLL